ncbi:MAG: nucleotidyltransferase domain-containing protein [Oligoflexia bacterium]|nr:nucleotidyltransferase domain-containing protein [Oligoflexia bacterium]
MPQATNEIIIAELENLIAHLEEWSQCLVLGGGVALIVYDQCMAGDSARPVGTTDLDFLIPRSPDVTVNTQPLSRILESLGFSTRLKSLGNPPIESYVKEVEETEIEVEFLTDDRTRKKKDSTQIPKAGVVAQSLSYLEMSLNSATTAKLPRGTTVRIVRPEAWVFHKGLTFTRRKPGSLKSTKDLYGIWFVLTMLGEFSERTWAGLKNIQSQQPSSWEKTFKSNLKGWVYEATPRDWAQLLSQDPEQRLKKEAFVGMVEKLSE